MTNCGTFVVSCNKQALFLQGNRAMPHVIFFDISSMYLRSKMFRFLFTVNFYIRAEIQFVRTPCLSWNDPLGKMGRFLPLANGDLR